MHQGGKGELLRVLKNRPIVKSPLPFDSYDNSYNKCMIFDVFCSVLACPDNKLVIRKVTDFAVEIELSHSNSRDRTF